MNDKQIMLNEDSDHRNPALILLDLNLPKADGFEVLRRIRADQRTRVIPVLVLTSPMHEQDLRTAYDLGANGYIRKPVEFGAVNGAERSPTLEQAARRNASPDGSAALPQPGTRPSIQHERSVYSMYVRSDYIPSDV